MHVPAPIAATPGIAATVDTVCTAETPEGIALTLRPAGVMARALGYLIDFAIRSALFVVIASVLGMLRALGLDKLGMGLMLLVWFAIEWLYPIVFELSLDGATPGKRALGLRVVMDSGLPVTAAASFTRNLLRSADFLPMFYALGLATMLYRADSKRLGDLAGGTRVVFSDRVHLYADVPAAAPLAPARALTPGEQAAIVSWASRSARLTPERFEELAALAAPVLGAPPEWNEPGGMHGAHGTGGANGTNGTGRMNGMTGTPGPERPAPPGRNDPGGRYAGPASRQLLGVAQWVLGRRADASAPTVAPSAPTGAAR